MSMACSICRSERRADIEADLKFGTTYRNISAKHQVSIAALSRHRSDHMGLLFTPNKIAPNSTEVVEVRESDPPEMRDSDDPYITHSNWRKLEVKDIHKVAKKDRNPDIRLRALKEDRAEDQHQITYRELRRSKSGANARPEPAIWEMVAKPE